MLFLLLCLRSSFIILNSTNFVELTGDITENNINYVIKELTYSKTNNIYLYINTNGGDVDSGLRLIHTLKSIDKNVLCIGEKIISMGFSIFQSCSDRIVMLSSTAMQHQMSISLDGQLYTLIRKLDYLKYIDDYLLTLESKRINIPKDDYKSLIEHEWWLHGYNIVKQNVADKLSKVICSKTLSKTRCPMY